MKRAEILSRVVQAIPTGKASAVHLSDLAKRLDMKPATVKKYIKEARRQGEIILSSSDGYWIASDRSEIEAFTTMMSRQGISRLASIKGMNNLLKLPEGQQSLESEGR